MTRRALLLAALVVLAGCGAPTASPPVDAAGDTGTTAGPESTAAPTATGTATPTGSATGTVPGDGTATPAATNRTPRDLADGYEIRVRGGDLPVDYPLVFARVAVMLDRPGVEPPATVRVEPTERMSVGRSRFPEFYRLLGIRVPGNRSSSLTAAAYVASPRTVYVNRAILNDTAETASTLAHESVHVVQYRTGAFTNLRGAPAAPPGSTAARLLRTAVVEGTATYVQGAYRDRYVPSAEPPVASLAAAARNRSPAAALGIAPYVAGARYVEGRVDDPSGVRAVYETPPRTAEELLHGLPPGSEPVAELRVEDAPDDGWAADARTRDTHGELFVRVALDVGLPASTAAEAADGWGNDVRMRFENESAGSASGAGFAWALRFDDRANATEFAAAAGEWRDARPPDAAPVRVERVSDRTVVLLIGDRSFVGNATVEGTDGAVTVRVDGPG